MDPTQAIDGVHKVQVALTEGPLAFAAAAGWTVAAVFLTYSVWLMRKYVQEQRATGALLEKALGAISAFSAALPNLVKPPRARTPPGPRPPEDSK